MKLISFEAYITKVLDLQQAFGMTEEQAEERVAKSYAVDWSL